MGSRLRGLGRLRNLGAQGEGPKRLNPTPYAPKSFFTALFRLGALRWVLGLLPW